jgi:hypothetical protein
MTPPTIEDRAAFEAIPHDFVGVEWEEELGTDCVCECLVDHLSEHGWSYAGLPLALYRRKPVNPRELDYDCEWAAERMIETLVEDGIVSPEDGDPELQAALTRAFQAVTQRLLRDHESWHCECVAVRHYSAAEIREIVGAR